jgi:hypothetical protein
MSNWYKIFVYGMSFVAMFGIVGATIVKDRPYNERTYIVAISALLLFMALKIGEYAQSEARKKKEELQKDNEIIPVESSMVLTTTDDKGCILKVEYTAKNVDLIGRRTVEFNEILQLLLLDDIVPEEENKEANDV